MELQQQVTSQEISIKMKDLGITEPSIFYRDYRGSKDNEIEMNKEPYFNPDNVNAYTVAELGEMLKDIQNQIDCGDVCYDLTFESEKSLIGWGGNSHEESADTEADARAKMLIYLKENNLL